MDKPGIPMQVGVERYVYQHFPAQIIYYSYMKIGFTPETIRKAIQISQAKIKKEYRMRGYELFALSTLMFVCASLTSIVATNVTIYHAIYTVCLAAYSVLTFARAAYQWQYSTLPRFDTKTEYV